MGKTILIIVGIILSVQILGFSQESNFLQFLPGVSQSSTLNPAIQNKTDKIVIGIPVISGMQFGWNSNFALNSLFSKGFSYSFANFYDNLEEQGEARFGTNASMFYASFKLNNWNLSFSLTEKAYGTTTFDRDIVKIIRDGNQGYYGKNENFGKGSFHYEHYRDLSFGISNRFWKELDIGIRPKLLLGRFYFDSQDLNVSLESDMENEELLLYPEGSFTLSGPLKIKFDSTTNFTSFASNVLPADYFFNTQNMGFAIDFGFVFRPTKKYEIAASISDLGFVSFKHNTFDVDFIKPIRYTKNTLYQSVNQGNRYLEPREALKAIGDSVSYIVNAANASHRIFSPTPFKVNISGTYNLSNDIQVGVADIFTYYGKYSANHFSGFLHKTLSEKFEFASSLTLYNISSVWLGLGGSYTANYFQFYFTSNNILGIVRPTATKNLNLCLGINFLFTTKKR